MNRYKDICWATARHYGRHTPLSLPGALLKASLVPLTALDRFVPEDGTIADLGCGEGIFANSLARLYPQARVIGIDLDIDKIGWAEACRINGAEFRVGDAETADMTAADAVVFNDMLHHVPPPKQAAMLQHARDILADGGVLVLKEVNPADRVDRAMTSFFDRKLYPDDALSFRTPAGWTELLQEFYFDVLTVEVLRHPWVASRTLIVARKSPAWTCYADTAEPGAPDPVPGAVRVLVTGASGFIGHHLAMHLKTHGLNGARAELVLPARNPARLDPRLRQGTTLIRSDLASLPDIRHWRVFDGVDYVFHFAAEVDMHGDPVRLEQTNVEGTRSLVSVFADRSLKRFVHASTMGAVDRRPDDACTDPMDENTPPHPLTTYGRTKLTAEGVVRDSGLPHTIIRIPWAAGPRMSPSTHVRNLFERVMKRSAATRVDFPGRVSIVSVEDLVNGCLLAAAEPKAVGETYFITGPEPVSIGDLFRRMSRLLTGAARRQIPVPWPVPPVARRLRRFFPLTIQNLNSDVLWVDDSKIRALGYRPQASLDDLLLWLCAWIRAQRRPKQRFFLVTGAASGIGAALARKLVAAGHRVLLADMDAEALARTGAALRMPVIDVDLRDPVDVSRLQDRVGEESRPLYGLVNCAGIGRRGALAEMDAACAADMIAVNAAAVAALSQWALAAFAARADGVLVNISSTAGLQPLPYFAVYSASKAFVSALTRSVGHELRQYPRIHILDVVPSGTDTGFQAAAGVKKRAGEKLLSPEYVADRIARLIETGAATGTHFIGSRATVMALLARFMPRGLNTWIWGRLVERMR